MKIFDQAIIVALQPFQEDSSIVTAFTKEHGIYSGIVKKIKMPKNISLYQVGNLVDFAWNARLNTHIGTMKCDLIRSYGSVILHNKTKLYAMNSLLSLIKTSLKEHEKYPNLFEYLNCYFNNITQHPFDFLNYIKIECLILEEVGYGLDLSKCTSTGSTKNLSYVSPKSGKAVSKDAGAPYSSLMLKLPEFLHLDISTNCPIQIKEAIDLTGYFFKRYIFTHQEPYPRQMLYEHLVHVAQLRLQAKTIDAL